MASNIPGRKCSIVNYVCLGNELVSQKNICQDLSVTHFFPAALLTLPHITLSQGVTGLESGRQRRIPGKCVSVKQDILEVLRLESAIDFKFIVTIS